MSFGQRENKLKYITNKKIPNSNKELEFGILKIFEFL
jgi:hypothetical protein